MKFRFVSLLFLLALALSCEVVKEVPYFQDASKLKFKKAPEIGRITLRPDDKISIIVKSKDATLTSLFNLPYYTQRIGTTAESMTNGYTVGISGYMVGENGEIDFPVLGRIKAAGLTRGQLAEVIQAKLIEGDLVKDPVVTIDFLNLYVSVMGEVQRPGRFQIDHDEYTLLDAISAAGDMTIYGVRTSVKVMRDEAGEKKIYSVNLCSAEELASSPVYYLKQNDVVYVEPNKMRARQSTVNGNNVLSTSFWISIASLAVTILLAVNQFSKK